MRKTVVLCLVLAALLTYGCTQISEAPDFSPGVTVEPAPKQPSLDQLKSQVDKLLTQMSAKDYDTREKATNTLRKLLKESGEKQEGLVKYLEMHLKESKDLELRHRLERIAKPWEFFEPLLRAYGGAAFSPDGKLLAARSLDPVSEPPDGRLRDVIRIWSPRTGKCLRTLADENMDWPGTVTFSPDGKLLASVSRDQTPDVKFEDCIRIWNVEEGMCLHRLVKCELEWGLEITFSPDSKLLAASIGRKIRVWDPRTGNLLRTLEGHTEGVRTIAFSPNGSLLASGARDDSVRIWNPHIGECLHTLKGHTNSVLSVRFSPDGKMLASASRDDTVRIWKPTAAKCLATLEGHTDNVYSIAFSQDSKLLASVSTDELRIWNYRKAECLHAIKRRRFGMGTVAFSPEGRLLAWASTGAQLLICNRHTGQILREFQYPTSGEVAASGYSHVEFSSDGRMLLYIDGYAIGTATVWGIPDE